jgi:hypothetical protein
MGIKVKDYAYESTLPPILPYRRVPIQSQPDPVAYKRRRDQVEGEVDLVADDTGSFSQSSQGGMWDPFDITKVKRQKTEPAIPEEEEASQQLTRQLPYLSSRTTFLNPSQDSQMGRGRAISQQTNWSSPGPSTQSQQPPSLVHSQDTQEDWVDTPLVTPNGSLQWMNDDTDIVPSSQPDEDTLPLFPLKPDPGVASHGQPKGKAPMRSRIPLSPINISPFEPIQDSDAMQVPSSPLTPLPSSPLSSRNVTPPPVSSPTPAQNGGYGLRPRRPLVTPAPQSANNTDRTQGKKKSLLSKGKPTSFNPSPVLPPTAAEDDDGRVRPRPRSRSGAKTSPMPAKSSSRVSSRRRK